ncbi:MAG: HAD family phosphatase [Candidatus Methylarchaceae archaeon HK02M1]|nr:HAD family phosphatase [Candidatus Methylarchaceae archaeon HK01M]MCP8311587.1 HAD family phosphatase [Candidatus Methylarchaceae archaeon HK02M1]
MRRRSKLVAFDMDGTLLNGRVIYFIGERFGFLGEIKSIMRGRIPPLEKSKIIAKHLAGLDAKEILDTIKKIPLMTGALETIDRIKEKGYPMGVISDSFTIATSYLTKKLDLDFHMANDLEVQQGIVTGRIFAPLGWEQANCSCRRSICKRFFLRKFANSMNIPISNCIAIGDSLGDWCMLEEAGMGIAFHPKDRDLTKYADEVIKEQDLTRVLRWIV